MRKVVLWLFMGMLLSAEVLEIGLEESYKTQKYMTYTLVNEIDETPNVLDTRTWEVDKKSFNTFENFSKAYWVKLLVRNTTAESKIYYLKSENQFTYHIEFFLFKNKEQVLYREDGTIALNNEREFNVNHMIFPLFLDSYEEATIFFKIQNHNKIDLDFNLETEEYLVDFYQTYNMLEGIFLGGMVMMIFYNLFLFFLFRSRIYVYYILYIFWISVYFFGFFGFFQRYFMDYLWVFFISSNFFFIFMILFIQTILNLKKKLTQMNKLLNVFKAYFFLSSPPYLYSLYSHEFLYTELLFNLAFVVIGILMLVIISLTYYLAYMKDETIAKTYSFIWTMMSIGGVVLVLVHLTIIELNFDINYIVQLIIWIEVLFFSFVLAYKVKSIEQEKQNQEMLLDAQNKLVSMGEMVSTIAHQWRQPLSEINGIVLSMDLDYNRGQLSLKKFDKHIKEISDVHTYLNSTINDFINFFNHEKEQEFFVISDVLKHAKRLILISRKEKMKISSFSDVIKMKGYPSELLQGLLIVINNAIDAGSMKNKKILVDIKVTRLNDKYLSLSIEDNGGGISPEILKNIFNPYFTTKHEFKGTGLGLYILKMIIEESMHGKVRVYNKNLGVICEMIIPIKVSSL